MARRNRRVRLEIAVIVILAGALLPPGHALRLGALSLIGLGVLGVYGNTPYMPGAGNALGQALLFWFYILLFGAITLGLMARWIWSLWRGPDGWMLSWRVPAALDLGLIALAMVIPAGMLAVVLGDGLAGSDAPLRMHLILLAICASLGLGAFWLPKVARAAELGFALTLAAITVDSMRLDGQLHSQLPATGYCLAIGPDHLPPDQVPPLMGLTAPKPIVRVILSDDRTRAERWSFRGHRFVRDGTQSQEPPCTPTPP
ncbi:MAG: hypothetical protein WAS26_01440 [Paracoccaceae bacterium]